MKRLEFGTLNEHGNDAVFLALCSTTTLSSAYKELEGIVIPTVCLQARWCGDFGFIGGKVDKNESLQDALYREVYEEVGVTLVDELTPVCTHTFSTAKSSMNTHLFKCEVKPERLQDILCSTTKAPHFISENCGNIIVHLQSYGTKGLDTFINNRLASSVKEELYILAKDYGVLITTDLPKESIEIQRGGL